MRTFALLLCGGLLSIAAFGQAGTGTITGTVTDPAGAVVANAPIEVRNTDTNVPYPTVTTETGAYTVLRLPPGPYSVTVSAPGFKKLIRAGLTVDAGQTLPLDLTLEVGSATESVTVTAEGTLLKTESGDVSHNITLSQLDDLPILGIGTQNAGSNGIRNPYNSAVFLPGVSYFANFTMIVNGAPTNTAGYRIEGLDNTNHTVAFAIMQNMPNADAIQEMAIQTSNYAAEFGQAGGGLFNITMKSGTNQFHGSAFEYFVNEDLNAAIPFSFTPEGGKFRPRNRRNDYGGTFGGPFIIPKVYNGKNQTFFFYSYERYKEAQALTFTDTLPNAHIRAGDFSAISPNGGAGFNTTLGVPATLARDRRSWARPVFANAIYDPTTRTTVGGVGVANPFPNNMIPADRIQPGGRGHPKPPAALSTNGNSVQQLHRQQPGPAHHGHSLHQGRSVHRLETEAVLLFPPHRYAGAVHDAQRQRGRTAGPAHGRARIHSDRRSDVSAQLRLHRHAHAAGPRRRRILDDLLLRRWSLYPKRKDGRLR